MIDHSYLDSMSLSELEASLLQVKEAIQQKRNEDRVELWCVDINTLSHYKYFRKQDYKKALEFVIEQTNSMLATCENVFDEYNVRIEAITMSKPVYDRYFPLIQGNI